MTHRITAALAVILIGVGSAFAQTIEIPSSLPVNVDAQPGPPIITPNAASPSGWDGRFWLSADYLMTITGGDRLPALVTTSPTGTAQTAAGVLGLPTTTTLFGDSKVNNDFRSGFRVGAGYWLNADHTYAVEFGFMMIGSQATSFSADSNQFPILARPFANAETVVNASQLIAYPGNSTGSVAARASSDALYESHFDLSEKALDLGWFRLDALIGYRFYSYGEGLHIQQTLVPGANQPFAPGTQAVSVDDFNTSNIFQGVDMGLRAQFYWGKFSLELLGKVAFGALQESVTINGSQTVTATNVAPAVSTGGFYALRSNSGTFYSTEWWSLPEIGATFNWQLTPNVQLRLGYSLLLLNGIARAADQIDTTINPNFFPNGTQSGPSRPAFNLNRSDLTIQSVNLGVVWTY
jgi:hypothetical protein